jgi:hypothetical protein
MRISFSKYTKIFHAGVLFTKLQKQGTQLATMSKTLYNRNFPNGYKTAFLLTSQLSLSMRTSSWENMFPSSFASQSSCWPEEKPHDINSTLNL